MSTKKRIFAAVMAVVLAVASVMAFSGCSSQVIYAMEIDGEKIPAGLYILYSGYAYQTAQQQLLEEQPDLNTSAEGFDYTAQKVSDMDFMDYVKQETVNNCKRYVAVNNLFDKLNITFDQDEKDNIDDSVNGQWDYAIPEWITGTMTYLDGFDTLGAYYESIGVSKSSLKLYVTESYKASKIFSYYYGEGGIEEVSNEEKEQWIEENYALCRYFSMSIKDSDGNLLESKTELALIKNQAEEYAQKLNDGESYKDVYDEYTEYSEAQTSTADESEEPEEGETVTTEGESEPAEQADDPDVTAAADDETEPDETAPEETEQEEETADTTAEETEEPEADEEKKDSDYDRIISKDGTSPSEQFVKSVFEMENGKATVIEEDTAYYVVQKLDILDSDQDYVTTYSNTALEGLKGDEMEEAFKKEYADYTVTENKSAPDYCKQQAANAANGLSALTQIQYMLYYYSMFGL